MSANINIALYCPGNPKNTSSTFYKAIRKSSPLGGGDDGFGLFQQCDINAGNAGNVECYIKANSSAPVINSVVYNDYTLQTRFDGGGNVWRMVFMTAPPHYSGLFNVTISTTGVMTSISPCITPI